MAEPDRETSGGRPVTRQEIADAIASEYCRSNHRGEDEARRCEFGERVAQAALAVFSRLDIHITYHDHACPPGCPAASKVGR